MFESPIRRQVLACLLLVAACSCLRAGDPIVDQSRQTTQPAGADDRIFKVLDRLEAKGQSIRGLSCKIVYKYVTVEPVEDEQIKDGDLLFLRAEPNSKFLVRFKKLRAAGLERDTGEYYAFDGQWLIERNDKAKTIVKRQIAAAGERKDPFKIGSGPFPLPFGQKRADMLSQFKISLEDFTLGDPRNSDHLKCIPLPGTDLADQYTRVELFVDRALDLPVRIVTERVKDGNRIEVEFKDIDASAAPAGSRFVIDEPKDYEITVEPLAAQQGKGG